MAVHRNLNALGNRLEEIAEGVPRKVEAGIRKAGITGLDVAVFATPVDTGQARGGWLVGSGSPPEGVPEAPGGRIQTVGNRAANEANAAGAAIDRGLPVIFGWNLAAGSLFLGNNVGHIVYLDEGSSGQAPSGITPAAIRAIRRVLRKIKAAG